MRNPLVETPREKQIRFRQHIKETMSCLLITIMPVLMFLHWLVIGY